VLGILNVVVCYFAFYLLHLKERKAVDFESIDRNMIKLHNIALA